MRRLILAAVLALTALAPVAMAGSPSWRYCGGSSGGAFNTRVLRISCGYAAHVTENGLRPELRGTRLGGFACRRHRAGSLWSYRCVRAQGREALTFNTY